MAIEFPSEVYGQRWQVETTYSQDKRRFGSQIAASTLAGQFDELMLRVLVHNLAIIIASRACFQPSRTVPALGDCPRFRGIVSGNNMKKASQLFTEDDRKRIAAAVADAEANTSAEIVPVVATSSGRYDRAEDVVGLWLGLTAVGVVWWLFQDASTGDWGETELAVNLPMVLGLVVVGWLVGVGIANRVGWLRRLFTPRREMQQEVQQAARRVFFDSRVHHTQGSAGVLIYISLFEHVAVVLADQQATEKLGQEKLDALCNELTAALRQRKYTDALCTTIAKAGAELAGPFPHQSGDKNELADALITID